MSEDLRGREVTVASPEFAEVLALADAMRDAIANLPELDWQDPETMGKSITAACVFAGMMFGQLIAVGLATDQNRRRAGDMALRNFRSGIEPGKRAASRLAGELGSGGLMQ